MSVFSDALRAPSPVAGGACLGPAVACGPPSRRDATRQNPAHAQAVARRVRAAPNAIGVPRPSVLRRLFTRVTSGGASSFGPGTDVRRPASVEVGKNVVGGLAPQAAG
jgi:hypothetical protein